MDRIMSQMYKMLIKILSGKSDSNINFNDLCNSLENLGFTKRIKGSHFIFRKDGIDMMITLQKDGSKAKSYQLKQIRKLIIENNLGDYDV